MKRFASGLLIGLVIAFAVPTFAEEVPPAEPAPIKLVVNGQEITLPDAQPVVVNGQVMVPVMAFSQVAGFGVLWDEANRTVWVTTTTAAVPAVESPEPAVPLTITEDGVTYYEVTQMRALLESLYPNTEIWMGMAGYTIGDDHYDIITKVIGKHGYADVRPLLEAEVLSRADLDRHYGR